METDKDSKKKPEGFALRLRAIRQALQLRQADFAERLNISGPALSEIENDKYKPGYEFLYNAVKEFNINLYYLLFGEGDMFRNPMEAMSDRAGKFAVNIPDVRAFIDSFERSSYVQYSMLAHFRTLMLRDREIIEQDIARAEADKTALKPNDDG
ncbi:MAG: helix-turn-helix transcriptional regulator [Candidatus Aminicenantes bacterium]|nr:helix-turn-helix transcriptional regulator [Candidatus Aminicenantes bacterium]